jgi:RHS repeat-associated protein
MFGCASSFILFWHDASVSATSRVPPDITEGREHLGKKRRDVCATRVTTTTELTTARVFSPNVGRWHSPDPMAGDITNPQSLNRYTYVLNNPTTLTDPLGNCPTGTTETNPGQCAGDTGSTYQMWGGVGLEGGAINGPTNCITDSLEGNCNELYNNLHGSASLLFEATVGQGFAHSVWTGVEWSKAEEAETQLFQVDAIPDLEGLWAEVGFQLSTPTFLLGVSTPDWGGVFDITDLLGTHAWDASPRYSIRAAPASSQGNPAGFQIGSWNISHPSPESCGRAKKVTIGMLVAGGGLLRALIYLTDRRAKPTLSVHADHFLLTVPTRMAGLGPSDARRSCQLICGSVPCSWPSVPYS